MSEHSAQLTPLPAGFCTWLWRQARLTYMFVVVNFGALAQASNFLIKRRQVAFLWLDQDSPADWMPAPKPTELSMDQAKFELGSPSLWWASIKPIWHHYWLCSGEKHVCVNFYTYIHIQGIALAEGTFLWKVSHEHAAIILRLNSEMVILWDTVVITVDWCIRGVGRERKINHLGWPSWGLNSWPLAS